jgi:YidC/Oxa1 family membrane protein insertase
MDQKRLFLAIAISLAILLGYQTFLAPLMPKAPVAVVNQTEQGVPAKPAGSPGAVAQATPSVPKTVPRVKIDAPRVRGSISLMGARLDDIVLTDYRETLEPNSPHVRLLEPRSEDYPYYVQYGWTPATGDAAKVPDNDTVWTASADTLTTKSPVTLSWDNGAGLTFQIEMAVDRDYLFSVKQTVLNTSGQPVNLFPWSRIRRDYKPEVAGYYILFEGLYGVAGGTLQEMKNDDAKSKGEKKEIGRAHV